MTGPIDKIMGINWCELYRGFRRSAQESPGSSQARASWNAMAPGFAKKPKRSDYLNLFLEYLDSCLTPHDSVLDVGCGPGTLAVPLAQKGHRVQAVDFSDAMLAELAAKAEKAHVEDMIQPIRRSWQEDWEGIEAADVSIASRSLVTDDLADAIQKLEFHTKKHVFVTLGAGDTPWRDTGILRAMGRDADPASMLPVELVALVNYLFTTGRVPQIKLIEVQDTWSRASEDELKDVITRWHAPATEAEQGRLNAFLNDHLVRNEAENCFELDIPRIVRWACVDWRVPSV